MMSERMKPIQELTKNATKITIEIPSIVIKPEMNLSEHLDEERKKKIEAINYLRKDGGVNITCHEFKQKVDDDIESTVIITLEALQWVSTEKTSTMNAKNTAPT